MHKIYTVTMFFFSFVAEEHLWCNNSNIEIIVLSWAWDKESPWRIEPILKYWSKVVHHNVIEQKFLACVLILRITKGNSMLQTLHSETNFLETNFLYKLIQHTFQFITCKNIPQRVLNHQQKRNFPLTKASKIFVLNYVKDTTKKFNLQFFVFTWHFFVLNWLFRQKSSNNNKKVQLLYKAF